MEKKKICIKWQQFGQKNNKHTQLLHVNMIIINLTNNFSFLLRFSIGNLKLIHQYKFGHIRSYNDFNII